MTEPTQPVETVKQVEVKVQVSRFLCQMFPLANFAEFTLIYQCMWGKTQHETKL